MTLDFVVTRKSTETATMFLSIDNCLLKFAYICSSQLYRLPDAAKCVIAFIPP